MYKTIFAHLTPTREGLALGHTLITKRRQDGTLAIAGHEEEILALLSIGYGKQVDQGIISKLQVVSKAYSKLVPSQVLSHLRAASKAYSQTSIGEWPSLNDPDYYPPHMPDTDANAPSPKLQTLMHLALTGLNKAENIREIAPHLAEAKKMLAAGMKPLALLNAAGLLSSDTTLTWEHTFARYNPNHDPTNGEFTGPGSEENRSAGATGSEGNTEATSSQLGTGKTLQECLDQCWELALPTNDYGTSFNRCVLQCQGISSFPEWEPFFPAPG